MNYFGDFLSDQLAGHARSLAVQDTPVGVITRQGARRRQRRRALITSSSLVAASVTAVGAAAVVQRNDSSTIVVGESDADAISQQTAIAESPTSESIGSSADANLEEPPLTPVASNLTWNRLDPDSTESLGSTAMFGPQGIVGNGPFYALSTSPGRGQETTPTLYRSTDAASWQRVTMPSYLPQSIAARGDQLYAVGTAPTGKASVFETAISSSLDGGSTWSQAVLPLNLDELRSDPMVDSVGTQSSIVAGESGLVLVTTTNITLDPADLVPNWPNSFFGGYAVTGAGLEILINPVYGDCPETQDEGYVGPPTFITSTGGSSSGAPASPSGCVVDPGEPTGVPWSNTGISAAVIEALLRPVQIWYSTDGRSFAEVAAPDTGVGPSGTVLTTNFGDGYVVAYERYGQLAADAGVTTVLASADGLNWTLTTPPFAGIRSMGEVNGQLSVFAQSFTAPGGVYQNNTSVWQTSNLTDWSSVSLPSLISANDGPGAILEPVSIGFGPSGVAVLGQIYLDPTRTPDGVRVTKDGLTLQMLNAGMINRLLDAESGEILSEFDMMKPSDGGGFVGRSDLGFVVEDPRNGNKVTFTWEEQSAATLKAIEPFENARAIVLHSSNGTDWSREWVDEIAGVDIGPAHHVAMDGTRVVIAVAEQQPVVDLAVGELPIPKPILLIGTPKE
jgi:hypothetical protein